MIALLVAFILAPTAARAQDEMMSSGASPTTRAARAATRAGRTPDGPLLQRAREIVSSLNLSDGQRQKVDSILKNAAAEGREMMGQMEDMNERDRMERMRERYVDVREQIAAVLTDEQKVAFREKLEAARREMVGAMPEAARARPGQMLERLRESLAKLDLSEEQRKKVDAVVEEARGQAKELREAVQAGDEMAREKLGVALQDVRSKLAAILTPAQREKLRNMMEQGSGSPMGPGMMDGDGPMRRRDARRERDRDVARPATRPTDAAADKLKPGTRAPDFALKRPAGGEPIKLSSFEGRPLVIVFGSYSTPSFRQRAAGLEQLKKEYGNRASFLVIYTEEAHPKGEWEIERNKEEDIEVPAHKDLADREAMAEKAKDALKLTVPIVLDTMDNAAATAYGLAPNGAVVIGRDLKVVARQQWFDPYTLRRHIEAAAKPATRPAAAMK